MTRTVPPVLVAWCAVALLFVGTAVEASYQIAAASGCTATGKTYAMTCGGGGDVTAGGVTFKANAYLEGSPKLWSTTADVTGSGEFNEVFQSECVDKQLLFSVPVPKGIYEITLMNTEIYYVNATSSCPRVFSICGEGYLLQDQICLKDNGVNTAKQDTYYFNVDDGSLNLYLSSEKDDAKLSGFIMKELTCTEAPAKSEAEPSDKCPGSAAVATGSDTNTTATEPVTKTTDTKAAVNGTDTAAVNGTETTGDSTTGTEDVPAVDGTDAAVNGTETSGDSTTGTEDVPAVDGTDAAVNGTETTGDSTTGSEDVPAVDGTDAAVNGTETTGTEDVPAVNGTDAAVNGTKTTPSKTTGTKTAANSTTGTEDVPAVDGTDAAANGTETAANSTTVTEDVPAVDGTDAAANGTETAANSTTGTGDVAAVDGTDAAANGTEPASTSGATDGSNGTEPVTAIKSRSLPSLGGKPISSTVSQYSSSASDDALAGESDNKMWPTAESKVDDKKMHTASVDFSSPVTAQTVNLQGDFAKGDKVTVAVSGDDNTTAPTTLTTPVAAATKSLSIDLPKQTAESSKVTVSLPQGAKSKIDSIQLLGATPTASLTQLATFDAASNTLHQYATTARDSADSPGFLGSGTNATMSPDGKLWTPNTTVTSPNHTLNLNYDTPVNASQLLLTGKLDPKAPFQVELMDSAGKATKVFDGAAAAAKTAYRAYAIPVPAGLTNITGATITTKDPAKLGLDAVALVGSPSGDCTVCGESSAAPVGAAAAAATARGLPETFSTGGSYGASVLKATSPLPADALTGSKADAISGKPDGKVFAFPATEMTQPGEVGWVAAEFATPLEGSGVNVKGKPTGPGTLSASLVDKDDAVHYLGTRELSGAANVLSWMNFTSADNKVYEVKKVLLSANPASSWDTDAVQLGGVTQEAVDKSFKSGGHHRRSKLRVNGSRAGGIALVTICTILGVFCCCCLLPYLFWQRRKKQKDLEIQQQQQAAYMQSGQNNGAHITKMT